MQPFVIIDALKKTQSLLANQQSAQLVSHSMQTKSKSGIFKLKTFFFLAQKHALFINQTLLEPKTIQEALRSKP